MFVVYDPVSFYMLCVQTLISSDYMFTSLLPALVLQHTLRANLFASFSFDFISCGYMSSFCVRGYPALSLSREQTFVRALSKPKLISRFPHYFFVIGYFVNTLERGRGHYEVKTVSVDQWATVTQLSVCSCSS